MELSQLWAGAVNQAGRIECQLVALWERAGEQFSDSCILNAGGFMNAFSV